MDISTDKKWTLADRCTDMGVSVDTVLKHLRRTYPDKKWTAKSLVPPGVRIPAFERVSINGVITPAPEPAKRLVKQNAIPSRRYFFLFAAAFLVIGHACLVWYDLSLLWGDPGKIAGAIAFLFICGGMIVFGDEKLKEVADNMVWAVALLEGLAVVVHRAAFSRKAGEAYASGLGNQEIWALSAVVCLCSIGMTFFYKTAISK